MVCGAGVGKKCAGAGLVRAKFLKLLRVRGGFIFAGAGRVRAQNFNLRRTLLPAQLLACQGQC